MMMVDDQQGFEVVRVKGLAGCQFVTGYR